MKKSILQILFLFLGFFSSVQAQENLRPKLDKYLNEITVNKGFSGTALVANENKILINQGYGFADLKKIKPVKSDTKFYIASITKQFTASAILKLEDSRFAKTLSEKQELVNLS